MRRIAAVMLCALGLSAGTAAVGAETVTYIYDARGRLVKVVHSGTVNSTVQTEYSHDKADNRTNVKTTGAPS